MNEREDARGLCLFKVAKNMTALPQFKFKMKSTNSTPTLPLSLSQMCRRPCSKTQFITV